MALRIILDGTTGQQDGTVEVPGNGEGVAISALDTGFPFHLRCDSGEQTAEIVTVNAPVNFSVSKDNISYGATAVYAAGEIQDVNVICYIKQASYSVTSVGGLVLTPRVSGVSINYITVLLLHMNGTDGSAIFTDSEPGPVKTITAVSGAQIDTAQSKFGGASGLFGGATSYLHTPDHDDFSFGTYDFTIDFWVRFNSLAGTQAFIGQRADADNNWSFRKETDGRISIWFYVGAVFKGYYITTAAPSLSINTWYHIEMVRQGTSAFMFVNGVAQTLTENNAFSTNDLGNYAARVTIAAYDTSPTTATNFLNGWLDELRVSKYIARHTENFTPPTGEYT